MTTPQEQLAASRMLTARLHVALTAARDALSSMTGSDHPTDVGSTIEECDAALGHSEPDILALLGDVDRQAKVERLNAAAKAMVEACTDAPEDVGAIAAVNLALPALQAALLP